MHLVLWLPDHFMAQLGTCTSGIGWQRALRFPQALVHSPSVAAVSKETVPVWAILTHLGLSYTCIWCSCVPRGVQSWLTVVEIDGEGPAGAARVGPVSIGQHITEMEA